MGDGADAANVARFMRSPEGKEMFDVRMQALVGKTITDITFENHTCRIGILLHLNDGTYYTVYEEGLELEDIEMNHEEVLEREYYVDFPERKEEQPER